MKVILSSDEDSPSVKMESNLSVFGSFSLEKNISFQSFKYFIFQLTLKAKNMQNKKAQRNLTCNEQKHVYQDLMSCLYSFSVSWNIAF